jgi:hypothetical protein
VPSSINDAGSGVAALTVHVPEAFGAPAALSLMPIEQKTLGLHVAEAEPAVKPNPLMEPAAQLDVVPLPHAPVGLVSRSKESSAVPTLKLSVPAWVPHPWTPPGEFAALKRLNGVDSKVTEKAVNWSVVESKVKDPAVGFGEPPAKLML